MRGDAEELRHVLNSCGGKLPERINFCLPPSSFEILIHFDVLLFVLLFVLYTLVLFKVGIVDKNRFAHPQASCVVVPQGGGLCIHRREAAAL